MEQLTNERIDELQITLLRLAMKLGNDELESKFARLCAQAKAAGELTSPEYISRLRGVVGEVVAIAELRWLIERTYAKGCPAERREFWLGLTEEGMTGDSFNGNPAIWTTNPIEAARFSSKAIAEKLRYLHFHPEAPVEACEHMFNCGTTLVLPPYPLTWEVDNDQAVYKKDYDELRAIVSNFASPVAGEVVAFPAPDPLMAEAEGLGGISALAEHHAALTINPEFGAALWLDKRLVARIAADVGSSVVSADDPEPQWHKDAMVFVNAVNGLMASPLLAR